MKKLFICAALITCSVIVYAQGKTPPSFRNYLNNKTLYSPHVFDQPGKSGMHIDALAKSNDLKIDDIRKLLSKEKKESILFPGTFAGVLPNGNKLFLLPQDNMPCIVPDLSAFNMPVAKGNNQLDKKINGSTPW
jgi:hypothetical protein